VTPRAGIAAAVTALLALSAPAPAHRVDPAQAIASIRNGSEGRALGVVGARAQAGLPRLLVIEVDERWDAADPDRRRRAAEAWRALWRESTPQGLVAILDASGASRVGFDADGHAALHRGAPP
jgi:hypothetical protein